MGTDGGAGYVAPEVTVTASSFYNGNFISYS